MRPKLVAKRALQKVDAEEEVESEEEFVDNQPDAIRQKLCKVPLTQLVDLGNPGASEITSKFAPGSKYFRLVYPGKGSSHIGHSPQMPPLRSDLYGTNPEIIGKRYAMSAKDLDRDVPGITRRWKKVRACPSSLTCLQELKNPKNWDLDHRMQTYMDKGILREAMSHYKEATQVVKRRSNH